MKKLYLFILITLLFFPLISYSLGNSNEKLIENRKLISKPKLQNIHEITKFFKEFELYFNEHLP